MNKHVEVARTAGAYGVRGWVRVMPEGDTYLLEETTQWSLIDANGSTKSLHVTSLRHHGDALIVKFEGCDSKEAADALRGKIAIAREAFPKVDDQTLWAIDLLGMIVKNKEGILLGQVAKLGFNGVQVVLQINYENDEGTSSFLVPYVKDVYIQSVDETLKEIVIDWDADWR